MHHFTFQIISRFNRALLYKDLKIWNCQYMLDDHFVQNDRNVRFVLFTKTSLERKRFLIAQSL